MIKSTLKKAFLFFGGDIYLRNRNRTPRILFWHGVDENLTYPVEAESIEIKDFIEQIDYLEKHFEIISIGDFYLRYNKDKLNGHEVVLTFDDGYRNNLTVLAPELKKRNLPFTVYISTSNISEGKLFPTSISRLMVYGSSLKSLSIPSINLTLSIDNEEEKENSYKIINKHIKESNLKEVETICDELIQNLNTNEWNDLVNRYKSVTPMTWEEVKALKKYNCTIGSHCIDHICCHENQDNNVIEHQISESKRIIERELGVSCDYFAYPNGDYTPFSNKCVSEAGYLMGVSTKKVRLNKKEDQIEAMPRVSVPFNVDTFRILINLYPNK